MFCFPVQPELMIPKSASKKISKYIKISTFISIEVFTKVWVGNLESRML